MPFEMSREFPHFSSKSGVGDFCSCKLSILDTHPSLDSGCSGRCAEPVMSCSPAYLATKRRAATPEAARLTMSVCSLRQSRSREASDQGSHEGHADSPFGSDHADWTQPLIEKATTWWPFLPIFEGQRQRTWPPRPSLPDPLWRRI